MISISKFLSICDDGTILPYPAGQGNTRSRIITAAVDDEGCTFVYHDKSAVFSHFRTKQVKNAVNQAKMGFGAVNETAPKLFFIFRAEKQLKKLVYFCEVSALQRLKRYDKVTGFEP